MVPSWSEVLLEAGTVTVFSSLPQYSVTSGSGADREVKPQVAPLRFPFSRGSQISQSVQEQVLEK